MTTSKLARVLVISTVLAALSLGGTAYAMRARTRRPRATSPSPTRSPRLTPSPHRTRSPRRSRTWTMASRTAGRSRWDRPGCGSPRGRAALAPW